MRWFVSTACGGGGRVLVASETRPPPQAVLI